MMSTSRLERPDGKAKHERVVPVVPQGGPTRCPFCHTGCEPQADVVVCRTCLARHHQACWSEGASCSSCGADEGLSASTREPTKGAEAEAVQEDSTTRLGMTRGEVGLWALLVVSSAILLGMVHALGSFETMFAEVGVSLPAVTQLVLAPAKYPALSSLAITAWVATAALARRRRTAFISVVLGGAAISIPIVVVALFLPLGELLQKL